MNYLILAGGTGTRLESLNFNLPKPMIEIAGKPAIKRIVDHILLYDNKANIYISTFYKGEEIREFFKDEKYVHIVNEPKKLGTGGAIKFFLENFQIREFCLLNGDTLINFDLGFFAYEWKRVKDNYSVNSLVLLKRVKGDCSDYGTYNVEGSKVISFREKNEISNALVSTGVYFFKSSPLKKVLNKYPKKFSFEEEFLPEYIRKKSLAYFELTDFDLFFDIGTPEKLEIAKKKFLTLSKRPGVFFDRDNTLVHDDGYNADLKNYLVMQSSYLFVKLFQSIGYQVFIVSNQSSINRKINNHRKVEKFNNLLIDDFRSKGAYITDSVFCPHMPSEKCNCRKPKTLLVDNLVNKYNLLLKKSVFVGDSNADKNLAKNSGILFFDIQSKNSKKKIFKYLKFL